MKLQWTIGDQKETLLIQQPHGNGNDHYQIMIGKMYQGQIIKRMGEWKFYLTSKSSLSGYDIMIITEHLQK
jgi:hypothetical protein